MKIIAREGKFEQNINKSRFLGFSYFVENEEKAQQIIKKIENKYCDCRHVTYAYKIHPNIEKKGNSSEPAGTAGAPIFAVIEKNELTNVLIVVVRYFGGVLLGVQNLYRAYFSTALNAIENSEIRELKKFHCFNLVLDYSQFNQISLLSEKYPDNIKILNSEFRENVLSYLAVDDVNKFEMIKGLIKLQCCQVKEEWL